MDSSITFRLDAGTKKRMYEICEKLGMTPSTALNMFTTAFVREQGMPFPVTLRETIHFLPQEKLLETATGILNQYDSAYRRLAE